MVRNSDFTSLAFGGGEGSLRGRLHAAKCFANSVAATHIAGIPNVNRCNWSGRRETIIHDVVEDTIGCSCGKCFILINDYKVDFNY